MSPALSNRWTVLYSLEEKEHDEIKEDMISELGDDILLSILSRLGMKEATQTNILSRRWRYLSTNLTSLDFFDAVGTMVVDSFLNWVNQVVNLHRASSINDFRVCFPLTNGVANQIDKWVKFAVSKRVKNLELDLDFTQAVNLCWTPYTLRLCADDINLLSSLTSLCLRHVSISEELLELIISRSHLLERLVVEDARDLAHLKVTNTSRLKYLAICDCWKLDKLVIDAAYLVSFEFNSYNERLAMVYHNVPLLVEAKFGLESCYGLLPIIWETAACFSRQLTKLSLGMVMDMIGEDSIIPCFDNVKHLELLIFANGHNKSLFALRRFAEACPLLHEFKLQVSWPLKMYFKENYSLEDVRHSLEETNEEGHNFTLPHLRKLQWLGCFTGDVNAELPLCWGSRQRRPPTFC